jgi:ABC-type bacteriocin/lantibiotic exporter with double-glycine peptidase domain
MTFNVPFAKLIGGLTLRNLMAIPFGFLTAFKLAHIVDAALNTDFRTFRQESLELLVIVIVYYTIDYFIHRILQIAVEQKKNQLKIAMIDRYQSLDMISMDRIDKGKMIEHLSNDLNGLIQYKTSALPAFISASVTAVVYSGYFLSVHVIATLMLAFIAILHVIPPIVIKKYMYTQYMDTRKIEADLTNHIVSGFKAFRVLQIYACHPWFMQRLNQIHEEYTRIGSKAEKTVASEDMMTKGVEHAVKFGTYGIVGYLIWINAITLTNGLAFLMLSPGFYSAVSTLCSQLSLRASYHAVCERLASFHKVAEPGLSTSTWSVKQGTSSSLVLDVIEAKAEIETTAKLPSWHFQLAEQDHLMIQGKNGSGKSTFLRLLTRQIPLAEGQIYYCGRELTSIPEEELFHELALLPQEDLKLSLTPVQLFRLIYSDQPVILERTLQLCAAFKLNELTLEQNAIQDLSGGERKKVYLAAALMKPSASLILLDEPDNSLDENAKEVLVHNLQEDKRTFIIVSHDDLFEAGANRVIHLNGEHIEEQERSYQDV